ncbi:MAG: TolC family protein [Candidatus Paceibacterota bacterium]|jgi:NodT family efflux transporter outer membrane factor (OMF) lipoprotein
MRIFYRRSTLLVHAGSLKRLWLHLPIILALTGCTEFMVKPTLDVALPKSWHTEMPRGDQPVPLSHTWWRQIDDPVLVAVLEKIERDNLSIEQARFRLQAARSDAGNTQYLPNINLSASLQLDRNANGAGTQVNSSNSKTTGTYSAGSDVAWEIPLYGQYGTSQAIVAANTSYASADIQAVRAAVIAEAVQRYSQLRANQKKRTLLNSIAIAQSRISALSETKAKAGLIAYTGVARAAQDEQSVARELAAAEISLAESRQQLARLCGLTEAPPEWEAPAEVPLFPHFVFNDTPVDVIRNRPDIRKAEADVIVAAGKLDLAKADRYPKLSLTGSVSQVGNVVAAPFSGGTVQLSGMPVLTLPLFDWGSRLAKAKAQDARLAEKASLYREAVIVAINEVEQALAAERAAAKQVSSATLSEKDAARIGANITLLHSRGLVDDLEWQSSLVAHARSTIGHQDAKANHASRIATLTKALGGGIATEQTRL